MIRRAAPSKDEIAALPPFPGLTIDRVRVPVGADEFAAAAARIEAAGVVGFDTESKPTFDAGAVGDGPHVVQFATRTEAFVFQVHRAEGMPFLLSLLENPRVGKVGFGLRSDLKFIRAKFGVELREVVDLNEVFRGAGFRAATGVRAAVAIVFGQRFAKSKRQTTSNWALPRLDERQLLYAANDAYAALCVHEALAGFIERTDAAAAGAAVPAPASAPPSPAP